MGIVYEAEDTLLGRHVALKFLPVEVAHEPESLARFQREARAASSLNHPNICTIHEIGEDRGRWFIAMELLEGLPLDRVLAGGRVALDKVLDWATQISDALDAAHSRGIVHRDLKPPNIFLTKRGQLKVLDFGLAKMSDPSYDASALTSPATATLASPLTSPGLAVGTVAFMSPEQARGADLDARSDLFSFGTLLYQMISGRLPFEGKTTAVIFDAILNRDPVALAELNPDASAELQHIVSKCLEKDPDLRYQHASELRADLKRLRRDTGSAQTRGGAQGTRPAGVVSGSSVAISSSVPVTPPRPGEARPGSRSALVAAASQHRMGFVVGGLIAVVILAAASFGIYTILHRLAPIPFQNTTVDSITSGGDTGAAAISPDGKYVATLHTDADGRDSLWMQHLPTNSNTQIVAASDLSINSDLAISPDGNYVYYRTRQAGGASNDLYRVPVLGGTPTLITRAVDTPPSFSVGSGRFCFIRYQPSEDIQTLLSASPDGSAEKVIYSGKGQNYYAPAWSPDGKHIIVAESGGGYRGMALIDAASGAASRFATLPAAVLEADAFAWMPDGKGFLVMYRNIDLAMRQIGYMSYPGAAFHHITNDLNRYGQLAVSADGKTFSTVLTTSDTSFSVFPVSGQTLTTSSAISFGPIYWFDWITNDQVVVNDISNRNLELISVGSQKRTPLLSSSDLLIYDLDACGPNAVVFTADPGGPAAHSNIYALNLSGGSPRQITSGREDQWQRCTPDGKWLVYYSFEDRGIRKIAIDGGAAQLLVSGDHNPDPRFSITPDGKQLVVRMFGAGANDQPEFGFISLETGQPIRRIPALGDSQDAVLTPNSQYIAFRRHSHSVNNIWLQPLSGGSPIVLTDFRLTGHMLQTIGAYAWSPDGKRLGVGLRMYRSDAVIFRQEEK